MLVLQSFKHNEERYRLVHHVEDDDSRTIQNTKYEKLMLFDNSTNVRLPNGTWLAKISQSRENRYILRDKDGNPIPDVDLGPLNDWHWKDLENAEIAAFKYLMTQTKE